MTAYRHLIVGSDGSDSSHLAVAQAAELAQAFGARLTIVTAFTKTGAVAAMDVPEDMRWQVTDVAGAETRAREASRVAKERGAADVRTRVASGDPADVLIEAAEELQADLLVLGSKGMTSPTRFLHSSVPNKVSHHAPCDVVIVRTVD
ncbi:MAG TPA: universal stress protein [Acidimicrobiales bacterium]|nr:universal stress protein [Acidimicrobiales bacterium]